MTKDIINTYDYESLKVNRFYASLKGENNSSKTIKVNFGYWIKSISGLGYGERNIVITCCLFKNNFITDLNKLIFEYNNNNILEVMLLNGIGEISEKIKLNIIPDSINYSYNNLDMDSDGNITMTINLRSENIVLEEDVNN